MSESIYNGSADKRNKQDPIPKNLDQILNDLQKMAINQLEFLGWRLWFVRRPLFQTVLPVLVNTTNNLTAVVGENGSLIKDHGMTFRP